MLSVSCPESLYLSAGCKKCSPTFYSTVVRVFTFPVWSLLVWLLYTWEVGIKDFFFSFSIWIFRLEWIFEPISKISWLHLCISISRLTILFPVADAYFFIHCLGVTTSQSQKCGMLFIQLYSFSTVKLYFLCISSIKKNPTDTFHFFKSTHKFENWHISYFDLPVHEFYI